MFYFRIEPILKRYNNVCGHESIAIKYDCLEIVHRPSIDQGFSAIFSFPPPTESDTNGHLPKCRCLSVNKFKLTMTIIVYNFYKTSLHQSDVHTDSSSQGQIKKPIPVMNCIKWVIYFMLCMEPG